MTGGVDDKDNSYNDWEMVILFQIKSMIPYQINVRRNRRWRPPSETEVQVLLLLVGLMLLVLVLNKQSRHPTDGDVAPQTKQSSNGRRLNGKYVYDLTGILLYSIHIQFFQFKIK